MYAFHGRSAAQLAGDLTLQVGNAQVSAQGTADLLLEAECRVSDGAQAVTRRGQRERCCTVAAKKNDEHFEPFSLPHFVHLVD